MSQLTKTLSSAQENEQAIDRSSQPRAWSFLTLLPYMTIAAYAAMIFWRIPGLLRFEGDDYLQTKLSYYNALPSNFSDYLQFISNRGYLLWSYKCGYELSHHNLNVPSYCFVGLFIGSAFVLYLTLRRCVSTTASLIGALLYLSFFAKFGAILCYNAQMYIPILLVAILICAVLMSKLSRGAQCAIVAPMYWLTLHFYEILMVTAPALSIIWLAPSIIKRKMPGWRDIIYSLVPWLIIGVHIFLLGVTKVRVWDRNPSQRTTLATLPHDLWTLFCVSGNQMFGGEHWQLVQRSVTNFFTFDLRADHSLWIPLTASAVCTLFALRFALTRNSRARKEDSRGTNSVRLGLLLAGCYLALFGSLIIIAEYTREVPTRLLLLPSLGLALAVAAALDCIGNKRLYKLCAASALVWCLLEATAFSDIVRQHIDSIRIDTAITQQFNSLSQLCLKPGDNVFISMPYTFKRFHYWAQCHPRYYTDAPICLWSLYDLGFDRITYANEMRPPSSLQPIGLYAWMTKTLEHDPASHLCPFYLDDKQKLRPITTISIIDKLGYVQKRIPTRLNGQVDTTVAMDMKLLPGDAQ